MNIKKALLYSGLALFYFGSLAGTNYSTRVYTEKQTVAKVLDNLSFFCYNNRSGAIIEGPNGIYILCRGVRIDEEEKKKLDNEV